MGPLTLNVPGGIYTLSHLVRAELLRDINPHRNHAKVGVQYKYEKMELKQ